MLHFSQAHRLLRQHNLQPDEVSRALIKGMERGKVIIIPGFDGKLTFVLKRLFPRLVDFMISRDIRKAQDGKS